MRRILIPPAPGLFSAFGLLYAEVEHHYARTFRRLLRGLESERLDAAWDGAAATQAKASSRPRASRRSACRIRRLASLHYQGQSFDLTVPVGRRPARCAGGSPRSRRRSARSTSAPTAIAPGPRSRSS